MSTIANKYYIKKGTDSYADFTTKWVGLTLLTIDDFNTKGAAKNIYTADWINSNTEDVYIPDIVCFKQPDINFTFIVKDFDSHSVNVQSVHDSFIDYMTTNKVTIKSLYSMKEASFVCLTEYKPTTVHVKRVAGQNYIIGTITMHRVTANNTVAS